MRVERLGLEDFRNYERQEVAFGPGLNLVRGRNAQGKTNLLEAIHCLTGMGSPRGPDGALVRSGAERALLHAAIARGDRTTRVDIEIKPGRGTRALINKVALPRTRSLSEFTVTVFFGPDELSLVKGSPDGRRRFLDELGVKLKPAHDAVRREFERVLRQRNALLKTAPRSSPASVRATLEVWDEALIKVGSSLALARLRALGHLLPFAAKRYEEVAGGGRLELTYESRWLTDEPATAAIADPGSIEEADLQSTLRSAIESRARNEIERGVTLVGPQRDDVGVRVATGSGDPPGLLDARVYASQGDQRTCALALKLGEHDLLSDALDDQPILLLDDVFSELDPHRRGWLKEAVGGMTQAILSSAEPAAADDDGVGAVIEVEGGKVQDALR